MFKKFLLLTSSGLLKLALFFLALFAAAWMTFSTASAPKKALQESGVYDDVVQSVLDETEKSVQEEGDNIPVNAPEIQAAAEKAFPPEFLQQNVEGVIDGVYSWLHGETELPQFTIDISAAKQTLVAGAADYAATRAAGLPVCTIEQLRALGTDIDPFSAPCRPPGLTAEQVRAEAQAQLASQDQFLKDTVITGETLKDENGQSVFKNAEAAPTTFQLLSWVPWVLALVAVICAVGVLFLSETKKRGLRTIGVTLVGVGVFLFLGSLLMSWLFNNANQPGKLVQAGNAFSANIIRGLQSIFDTYNKTLMNYYIVYMVLGTIILGVLWWQNRQTSTVAKTSVKVKG